MILMVNKLVQKTETEEVKDTKTDKKKKHRRKFIPIPYPPIKYKQYRIREEKPTAQRKEHEKHTMKRSQEAYNPEISIQLEKEKRKLKISAPILIGHVTSPKIQRIGLPKIPTKKYTATPMMRDINTLAKEIAQQIYLQKEIEEGRVEKKKEIWERFITKLKQTDPILIEALYLMGDIPRDISALKSGDYREEDLLKSLVSTLKLNYDISDEKVTLIEQKLFKAVREELLSNPLYLYTIKDILTELCYPTIKDTLLDRIEKMNIEEKRTVLTFLLKPLDPWPLEDWQHKFSLYFERCFDTKPKTDVLTTLVKVGIILKDKFDEKTRYKPIALLEKLSAEMEERLIEDMNIDLDYTLKKIGEVNEELRLEEEVRKGRLEQGTPEVHMTGEIIPEETAEKMAAGGVEEVPQVEDLEIFEKIIKSSSGIFPRNISNDKPVVVILPKSDKDNYGTTIDILCREIFRELVGGLPTGKIRSKGDKDIEKELRAEDRIEHIDDSKTEYVKSKYSRIKTLDDFKMCINWEKLSDRLQELVFQGFGFIIFEVKRDFVDVLKTEIEKLTGDRRPQLQILYPRLEGRTLLPVREKLSKKDLKPINLIPIKKEIASLCWGMVSPQGDDRWDAGTTFDNFFSACENAFYEELQNIGESAIKINGKHIPPQLIVKDGEDLDFTQTSEESNYHYWMKVFVVKYLIEKMKISAENIITEEPLPRGPIPDIKTNEVIIEVETLYGTRRPVNKLTKTIRKYQNSGREVWIVIKNLDVLFYYPEIVQLLENVNKEWNITCKFFSLNLSKMELINIKVVKEKINSLMKQVLEFETEPEPAPKSLNK